MSANTHIHEQQGLRIWKNAKNGFVVCRLHFTADPRKRGEGWLAASRQGISPAQWEQEFNINYAARQGQRAFPEIVSRRYEIVHREGPYIDGRWSSPMWAGFDYGAKNPSSFHVYTVVDGVTWCIWELYEPCKNLFTFVEALKACPFWSQLRYIAHDPDIGNLHSRNTVSGDVESVATQFVRLGVTRLLRGNNDEAAWLSTMAKHWCGPEITFKILDCCPHMIDEFEQATYVTMNDRQLETQNYREALVDRHNHSLDDCKYFMNSGAEKSRVTPIKLPSLVAGYGWTSHNPRRIDRFTQLGVS